VSVEFGKKKTEEKKRRHGQKNKYEKQAEA
jgi:hypothetical protein